MKTYFTSDLHYGHQNIVRGASEWSDKSKCRDYNSVEEMNEVIVNNINEAVDENDILYCLGDWSFGGYKNILLFREKIHCNTIHLILGNHDENIAKNRSIQNKPFDIYPSDIFTSIQSYKEIMVNGQEIVMFHYACKVWNRSHKGTWMLYGHSHGTLKDDPNSKSMDVGIDTNFMKPYSFEEIKYYMDQKNISVVDHHKKEEGYIYSVEPGNPLFNIS